ncbi:MAG: hypothetical protein AAGC71_18215 [Pseudomonadota bacterium]
MVRAALLLPLLVITACATKPPESVVELNQDIAECAEQAGLREGESLGNRFRKRATRAHCQKSITSDAEQD